MFVPKNGKPFGFFAWTLRFSEVSNTRMMVSLQISHNGHAGHSIAVYGDCWRAGVRGIDTRFTDDPQRWQSLVCGLPEALPQLQRYLLPSDWCIFRVCSPAFFLLQYFAVALSGTGLSLNVGDCWWIVGCSNENTKCTPQQICSLTEESIALWFL